MISSWCYTRRQDARGILAGLGQGWTIRCERLNASGERECRLTSAGITRPFTVPEMQCPACEEWKPKRAWTPSQYRDRRTAREDNRGRIGFDGCTECFAEAARTRTATPERWALRDPLGQPGFRLSDGSGGAGPGGGMQADIQMSADLLVAAWSQQLENYVERWMHLPERARKAWSGVGAVFSRAESDRVDDMTTGTFDPGNWCYVKTLGLLCPRSVGGLGGQDMSGQEVTWSGVTKGDICEGIMGAFFCAEEGVAERERAPPVTALPEDMRQELPAMAKFVENIAYLVNKIVSATPPVERQQPAGGMGHRSPGGGGTSRDTPAGRESPRARVGEEGPRAIAGG